MGALIDKISPTITKTLAQYGSTATFYRYNAERAVHDIAGTFKVTPPTAAKIEEEVGTLIQQGDLSIFVQASVFTDPPVLWDQFALNGVRYAIRSIEPISVEDEVFGYTVFLVGSG